ncbi:hypothetical protein BpHYR1_015207 [Brachionus plicatilis]|uniref:Uncharacterized protein n=1 Tax=Brachionus plicatilis TaxID=10195 RepID=A0A3M7PGW3_BRAPC|nr:hypothetical protein BpHYR1_015207 [Brachionus plicatilis]
MKLTAHFVDRNVVYIKNKNFIKYCIKNLKTCKYKNENTFLIPYVYRNSHAKFLKGYQLRFTFFSDRKILRLMTESNFKKIKFSALMTMYELSMLAATSFVQSFSFNNYIQQLFNKTQKEHEECENKFKNTPVYTLDLSMIELRDLVIKHDSDKIENVYCLIYVLEEESIRKANSERRLSQSIIKTTFQRKSIVRSSFNEIYSKNMKKEVFQTKTLNINSLKSSENFKLGIKNLNDFLVIEVFKEGNKKNINQNEKYFLRKVWRSVSESRKLRKDFIGQFKIQIKNLKDLDSDWNQLKCRHNDIQHDTRGLLKFQFVCSIDFKNETENEKIESWASNDTTKLLNQYKYLLKQIFEFEILKQNKEYLSKIAIDFLRIFTDFYMIPSNSKILMEIFEMSKLVTLNKLDLKILLDQAKSLEFIGLKKFSQFEKNEFESTVFNIFKCKLTDIDREIFHRLTMLLSEMLNRKVQKVTKKFSKLIIYKI